MAKYLVNKKFRDKYTKEIYEAGKVYNITVKRADEIIENLDGSFLSRQDKKKK